MNRESRRMRVVLVTLLLVSFTLIALDYRSGHGSPFNSVRRAAASVFGPVERAATSAFHPLLHLHIGTNTGEVTKLRQENEQLKSQLNTSDWTQQRISELDRLLGFSTDHGFRTVPAQVTAINPSIGFEWTATIDAGTRDGIRPNMTVINGNGLVGRVKLAGTTTSTVLLALDPEFGVGARVERTGEVGFLAGSGQRPMGFTLIDPQGDLRVGDRLVSWGSPGGAPFEPGIPIGRIVGVDTTPTGTTRKATLQPYVDFGALDLVGVVIAEDRAPRSPLPAASPPTASH